MIFIKTPQIASKLAVLCLLTCTSVQSAETVSGNLSCLKQDDSAEGYKGSCELSSALVFHGKLLTTNDKKDSTVLVYPFSDMKKGGEVRLASEITIPAEFGVSKVESLSRYGEWVFAVGSYVRNDKPQFSRIIAFKYDVKTGEASNFSLVSSDDIRAPIVALLSDAKYMKIEASMIIPGETKGQGTLYVGVREAGDSYKDGEFKYRTTVLSANINVTDEEGPKIDNSTWKIAYDMTDKIPDQGISDLSYNKKTKEIYMSTSYEKEGAFKTSLWKISLADFTGGGEFTKIEGDSLEGLKVEGVSNSKGNIVLITDQDRSTVGHSGGTRTVDQAPFLIIPQS
jgi:hypothetical protein